MPDVQVKAPVSKKRYFRANEFAGIQFMTHSDPDDSTLCTYERFTPKRIKVEGFDSHVGYLETENEDVIKKCLEQYFIEEVDKAEYDKR